MTLWVQNWPKLPKKMIFSKKSPYKCGFCVTHFPLIWLCQSFADIWPLTTLLLWLSIIFPCFLASIWAIMKPVEVEHLGVMNIFVKSFLGQQTIGQSFYLMCMLHPWCMLHWWAAYEWYAALNPIAHMCKQRNMMSRDMLRKTRPSCPHPTPEAKKHKQDWLDCPLRNRTSRIYDFRQNMRTMSCVMSHATTSGSHSES